MYRLIVRSQPRLLWHHLSKRRKLLVRQRNPQRRVFLCLLSHCMLGYTPMQTHSLGIHTPRANTPRLPGACWNTQCPVHAGIDMATAADGTHPTGMHSCM